jgi:tetratricopeptide (TPR) repeat protein
MSTNQLEEALHVRAAGDHAAALALLAALYAAHPGDARIAYEYACSHDVMGDEQGAIPLYEQALALGLQEPQRRGALLGLGSSYRCVGRYDEAIATFDQAAAEYADGTEFAVFRALALYNTGQHREAIGALLRLLADTADDPQIQRYARALRFYADHPDEAW